MKKNEHRAINIGDMRQRIYLHAREISTPVYGSIDFDEVFTGDPKWASIKSLGGKVVFDGVGQDAIATHAIYIRYAAGVSSQKFVQSTDGRRFKILNVEDYDERHDFLVLMCTDRGFNEAAKS